MLRNIKSFVRREHRLSSAQKSALATLWPKYGLEQHNGVLDFAKIFNRVGKVTFEIGFGMGTSLVTMAQQYPDDDFIGVEVHRPGVGALLVELEKYHLNNVRIFCADAIEVLQQSIPDNSIDKILLFFPDPWPKRKHHKRRIVNHDFIKLIASKLKIGGIFHFATDWDDYAQHVIKIMTLHPEFKLTSSTKDRPQTKFELRGKKLGHKIHDLIFTKE